MQKKILDANAQADLKVYAVWFNMLQNDDHSKWPAKILTDPRVRHFWDDDQEVGAWYAKNVTGSDSGDIQWDAYFLYGADAEWTVQPSGMVSWGRTIVATRSALQENIEPLLRSGV